MHTVKDPAAALALVLDIERKQEESRAKIAQLRRMIEAQLACEAQGIDYAEVARFGCGLTRLSKMVDEFDAHRRAARKADPSVPPPQLPAWRKAIPHFRRDGHGAEKAQSLEAGVKAGLATFVVLKSGKTVTLNSPILRPTSKGV